MLTNSQILEITKAQLALELNCSASDFDKDGFVFCTARETPGRRPFPRGKSHFDMLNMGKATIISATDDIMPIVRSAITPETTRDEAFCNTFVNGHSLYYLPDVRLLKHIPIAEGFTTHIYEGQEAAKLYHIKGFHHAIQYDVNHPRPEGFTFVVKKGDDIAAMAGVTVDCQHLWQIGLDVSPNYRQFGLASSLVSQISLETLKRGKIPYYGTASCNIGSQRVAAKVGFTPAWICSYRGRFEGFDTMAVG